jgi:hypothetical protein
LPFEGAVWWHTFCCDLVIFPIEVVLHLDWKQTNSHTFLLPLRLSAGPGSDDAVTYSYLKLFNLIGAGWCVGNMPLGVCGLQLLIQRLPHFSCHSKSQSILMLVAVRVVRRAGQDHLGQVAHLLLTPIGACTPMRPTSSM